MRALLSAPFKNFLRYTAGIGRPIAGNLTPIATPYSQKLRLLSTPRLNSLSPLCPINNAANEMDEDSSKNTKTLPDFVERLRNSQKFSDKLKNNRNLGGLSPHRAYQAIDDEDEGLFVRMDIPGLVKDEVKVWVEGKGTAMQKLMIQGEEKEPKWPNRRTCSGIVLLSTQNYYKHDDIEFDVVNGVLYLLLPKSRILIAGQGMQLEGEKKGSAFVEYKPHASSDEKHNKYFYCMRIDMPGFSSEEVKVWLEDGNKLCVKGEQANIFRSEGARTTGGVITLNPDEVYYDDEMEVEVKHGVLNIVLPKVKKLG